MTTQMPITPLEITDKGFDVQHDEIRKEDAVDHVKAINAASNLDPGPAFTSYQFIRFIACYLVACMCSGDSGFDGTVMSSTNSMVQYQHFFGLTAASTSTGIVFGIYTVGQVCAFFPAAYLPDKMGRRFTMFVGNLCLILGACLTSQASSWGMFLGGRFLTGLGCSTAAAAAKSYVAEITNPLTRGRYMGVLNCFYYVGQLLASGLAIPFGRFTGTEWGWRGVLLLQIVMPLINCLFIWFQPESPRWLYAHGRKEDAVRILAKFHSRTQDTESPIVQLQIQEIEVAIALDGADKRWWDFRQIFRTRGHRYRFSMCAIVAICPTLAGPGITYFLPILLGQAGITDPDRQRVLNLALSICAFAGAMTGAGIVDLVGRRTLMLIGTACCLFGNAIVAALTSDITDNNARANAGVVFIFLFQVMFSFGWTPLQGLYPAESLAFENRAKGLALQSWVQSAFSCITTFGVPPALAALKWKVYLIFLCFDFVSIIVIYTFVVETKQLSLEELDEVFDAPYPKKRSFELIAAGKKERKAGINSTSVPA